MNVNKFAAGQLADARYKSGLSLDQLSTKTGISTSALSRLLSGHQKLVPLETYLLVLHACNAPIKKNLDELLRHFKKYACK